MSVAECLGLGDGESVLLGEARAAWPLWCVADPGLAVVEDLLDVPGWTLQANGAETNAVIGRLVLLTPSHPAAVTALAWLLMPGATVLANDLRDLDADIDSLVAGQLWIEILGAHVLRSGGRLAATILRRTRREVCADLGVGDGAERRDRAWATSVRENEFDERATEWSADEVDPFDQVTELLADAMNDGVIEDFDAWLIVELARVAHLVGAPAHRGRMGLTTPDVVEVVAESVRLSTRTLRRRAVKAVDRIAEYVAVREDPEWFGVWRARHPATGLSVRAQMELVITDDASAYWVRSCSRVVVPTILETARAPSSLQVLQI